MNTVDFYNVHSAAMPDPSKAPDHSLFYVLDEHRIVGPQQASSLMWQLLSLLTKFAAATQHPEDPAQWWMSPLVVQRLFTPEGCQDSLSCPSPSSELLYEAFDRLQARGLVVRSTSDRDSPRAAIGSWRVANLDGAHFELKIGRTKGGGYTEERYEFLVDDDFEEEPRRFVWKTLLQADSASALWAQIAVVHTAQELESEIASGERPLVLICPGVYELGPDLNIGKAASGKPLGLVGLHLVGAGRHKGLPELRAKTIRVSRDTSADSLAFRGAEVTMHRESLGQMPAPRRVAELSVRRQPAGRTHRATKRKGGRGRS